MAQKVYGIGIGVVKDLNAQKLQEMSIEDKRKLIEEHQLYDGEMYTMDSFFYYLNSDAIDTENYYWFVF